MSRSAGLSVLHSNFETRIAAPLDSRMLVDALADLHATATWQSGDGSYYAYKGMLVCVCNDTEENNGVYRLAALPYTTSSNWVKLGTGEGTGGTGILVWYPDNSPPSVPEDGDAYYDTALGKSLVWSDGAWHTVANDGEDGAQGLPGEDGTNGITPRVGLNGNWFIGETDTDIPATGPAGEDGQDGTDGIDGNSINWLGELASAPGSPVNYDAYHNTTDGNSYIYNSTASAWQTLAQRGTDGEDGADGSNGTDGVSITWLGTLASAPAEPTLSTAYYNSTAKQAYIWDGDSWETLCKDGTDGQDGADGQDGTNGVSIFQQDITPLTGTPVSVSAGGVYSWTISAASVINKGTWADDGLEYAVMLITVEAGGSVTGGTGITLVDALVVGFNYCILRGIDGAVDLLISPE